MIAWFDTDRHSYYLDGWNINTSGANTVLHPCAAKRVGPTYAS